MNMEHAIAFLTQYGYIALFPLAIIEGPIVTIIGGFFVHLGAMNPFIVYAIVILGDIAGDTLYYAIGRFGRNKLLHWVGEHVGITEEKLGKVHERFSEHAWKALIASKLFQGAGPVGLVTAGGIRFPYFKYLLMCVSVSLVQSLIFLTVGILFGQAYATFGHYLDLAGAVTGFVAMLLLLYYVFYIRPRTKNAHE